MDDQDLHQIARDTLAWVGSQAVCVGAETGYVDAGKFGTALYIVSIDAESPEHQSYSILGTKLEKILELVDKACSLATLKRIATAKASRKPSNLRRLEKEIQQSLAMFVSESPEFAVLFNMIQNSAVKNAEEAREQEAETDTGSLENAPKHPQHVNNVLYSQLRLQGACSCGTNHLERARLRLESRKMDWNEEFIQFDILFRPGPASFGRETRETKYPNVLWKETSVLVPRRNHYHDQERPRVKSRIRFDDDPLDKTPPTPSPAAETSRKLGPGDFCKHIGTQTSSHLSFKIHRGVLRLLEVSEAPSPRNLKPVEGTSLAKLLDEASRITRRVKVLLAYTVARSVWQYYNTYWMSSPWTHEVIYFIEEKDKGNNYYKLHPYFSVHFKKHHDLIRDFYTGPDLTFRYPNVLALGMLLIEIGTGKPFKELDQSTQWDETQINDLWSLAWTAAAKSNLGNATHETYAAVVQSCLDDDLFGEAPFDEANPEKNLEIRRAILYSKIVLPLETLVDSFRDDLELHEIQKQPNAPFRHGRPNDAKLGLSGKENGTTCLNTDPAFLSPDVCGTGRWTPEYWLKKIDGINEGLMTLSGLHHDTARIKIAILDTGCNMHAEFFSFCTDDEDRLEGHWYDWVSNEPQPIDEHGHGTALVTLMLRMVRNAEIFVARVAKNAEGLQNAGENIAKAILHAAIEWDVDIVSMSFGFPAEVNSIKNAIRQAEDIKNSSIVFFAAAANDGSNKQEMFPASLESVISVRATTSNGSFEACAAYDPPPSAMKEESRLYGTLGDRVPYDWSSETLLKSGCSLATPIMAGITALIMEYFSYKEARFKESEYIQDHLRTQRGVIQLLKEISVNKGNQRWYVAPWSFFEQGEENRLAIVRTAIGKLPRPQARK
ncbi:uncharacterized protein PAC_17180 [Phialocephala subalpina]|uniref:Uncharacterized protein n=1 Tax=Phialocephala subalpina TaxID=576137 RepID=A0A1L7XQF5_9HELO|nr:uncharacterized protein PAC_17180 [Phialocephala subalpina]